jgi:hypothetical protein
VGDLRTLDRPGHWIHDLQNEIIWLWLIMSALIHNIYFSSQIENNISSLTTGCHTNTIQRNKNSKLLIKVKWMVKYRDVNGAGRTRLVATRYPPRLIETLPVSAPYPRGYPHNGFFTGIISSQVPAGTHRYF